MWRSNCDCLFHAQWKSSPWNLHPRPVQIDQFRYIKIQANTVVLRTRLWGINPTNSVFIPQSLMLRSIVLGWILIYRNWSIAFHFRHHLYYRSQFPAQIFPRPRPQNWINEREDWMKKDGLNWMNIKIELNEYRNWIEKI